MSGQERIREAIREQARLFMMNVDPSEAAKILEDCYRFCRTSFADEETATNEAFALRNRWAVTVAQRARKEMSRNRKPGKDELAQPSSE